MCENKSKNAYIPIFVTLLFLGVGIGILALTRHVAKIDGDVVFVVLLIIPVLIYLIITGKLEELSIFGVSASFMNEKVEAITKRVGDLEKNVTEISEYEQERNTYLGKLSQILKKASGFCLIYADVDGLRKHSRELFLIDKKKCESLDDRKSEDDIREKIIKKLDFALADAFCQNEIKDKDNKVAKYDIYALEEPDVVMIARETSVEQARLVAERALEIFRNSTKNSDSEGYSATITILSKDEMKDATPRGLDKTALDHIAWGKKQGRGKVYAYTSR
jgi:hypothetical protein